MLLAEGITTVVLTPNGAGDLAVHQNLLFQYGLGDGAAAPVYLVVYEKELTEARAEGPFLGNPPL